MIKPLLTQGTPISFPKSNAILVTDPLINLQRIEDVISKVDQPAEVKVVTLFYHLKHVSATDIVKRLQSMQNGSLKRYFENNTTFEAIERSNQLVVFTHHSNKGLIDDLISKLDIDVAPITQTDISLASINFLIPSISSEKISSLFITFIKNSNLYSLHYEIIKENV